MQVTPRARPRPMTRQVVVAPIYSRYSSYPAHGLTPQRLAAILREADEGDVSRQMELFAEMEEHDPHLYAQLQTRKNAVTGLDFEVVPFSDDPADTHIAAFVSEQLRGIRNLEDTMLDLLDAIGKGLSVCEILWQVQGDTVRVESIRHVPPKLLRWDAHDQLRIMTEEAPLGILLPPDKMICHHYKAKSGHPSRAGILRVVTWMYLFKNYTVKDWAAFIEVFGLPLRLGKYAAGASQDDKDALWKALVQIGTDAAGMVAEGTSIEFIKADTASGADGGVYETMARYCDEQVSKAILGQTLTSDSGSGSYAQSKTHNDVRHDLTVADCKALASTLRDDLIRPLVLYNFGQAYTSRLPSIVFDCELPEDLQALSGILQTLHGIGLPIPHSYLYQKFSIPEPAEGEAVTAQPAQTLYPIANAAKPSNAENWQKRVDKITNLAVRQSFELFEQMQYWLEDLDQNFETPADLLAALDDPQTATQLLASSTSKLLTDLLAETMLAADLAGRLKTHA